MRDASVYMEVAALALPVLVLAGVLVLVAVVVVTRRAVVLVGVASWLVFGLVTVLLPWVPHGTGHPVGGVSIVVANVMLANDQPDAAVRDLLAQKADILVVPEDSPPIHDRLSPHYRYARRVADESAWLGIFSNVPVRELPALPGVFDPTRYARVEVQTATPFILYGLHLPKPWLFPHGSYEMRPGAHARVLAQMLAAIGKETEPVVLAGDLNLTDRGRGYRKATAHLDDAMRSTWGARSETRGYFRPLFLRIDHILEPPSWCADRAGHFGIRGSDHRGITARVGPCR